MEKAWAEFCRSCCSFSFWALRINWRRRASWSKSGIGSSLPDRECANLVAQIEEVDFIFRSPRGFDGSLGMGADSVEFVRWDNSFTSLRLRRFLNSRAIRSRVVPRFLGVGGGRGCACGGDAGRGLLMGAV